MAPQTKNNKGLDPNLEYAKKNKNILFLDLDTKTEAKGTASIPHEISSQTITLKTTRICYVDSASALSYKRLYVKINNFGGTQFNSNVQVSAIPILADCQKLDTTVQLDTKVTLSKKITGDIKWELIDKNGSRVPADKVEFVQLVMEYELIEN